MLTGKHDTGGNDTSKPPSGVAVAIGGFLAGEPARSKCFWGTPKSILEDHGFRVLSVSPTSVGSLHDRACQIFYELKGGTVCYGREHSDLHGHACHGETFPGLFPEWGEDNPIHVIGHSYGGQTARVLQHLVASGFFSKPGLYHTTAAWVRSVTACNAPLNGSLLVYSLGERAETAPAVWWGSYGHLLSVAIHVIELLDWAIVRRVFDPRLVHFQLSWRHLGLRRAVAEVWRAAVGNSVIFSRADNAAFDMTVQSAHRWNQEIQTDPDTFYFSVSGTIPEKMGPLVDNDICEPPFPGNAPTSGGLLGPTEGEKWRAFGVPGWKGALTNVTYWALARLHAWQVGGYEQAMERLFGVDPSCWSSSGSDGVLEAFTQSHPRVPKEREAAVSVGFPRHPSSMKPGIWHTLAVSADHLWMHADEYHTRDVFERLARSLLLVASANVSKQRQASLRASVPESPQNPRPYSDLRRSPRLLARAQISAHLAANEVVVQPITAAQAVQSSRQALSPPRTGWVPCDAISTSGASGRHVAGGEEGCLTRAMCTRPCRSHSTWMAPFVLVVVSCAAVFWGSSAGLGCDFGTLFAGVLKEGMFQGVLGEYATPARNCVAPIVDTGDGEYASLIGFTEDCFHRHGAP